MFLLRSLLVTLLLSLSLSACAEKQEAANLTAAQAFEALSLGEVTLIDIRRPEEWRQTGVADGALRINMVHPQGLGGFAQAVYDAVGRDLDAPVVLICRTGNRTSRLQPVLKQMGFSNVRHVPEGMIGSRAGPGWITRGLPIDPCQTC